MIYPLNPLCHVAVTVYHKVSESTVLTRMQIGY